MRLPSLASLMLLSCLVLLFPQGEAAWIDVDWGCDYFETGNVTVTGYVESDLDYWRDDDFSGGTKVNISGGYFDLHLEPGLDVTVLNGGAAVFSGGSASSWDRYVLMFDVVKVNDTYHMFYVGANNTSLDGSWQIGLATSSDGVSWSRCSSNPVLRAGVDSYDKHGLTDPVAFHANGTWHLWYGGNRNSTSPDIDVCYATSSDGVSWTKYASNPVMSNNANDSLWNGTGLRPEAVIWEDSWFKMFYSASDDANVTSFGWMTSSDGKSWKDYKYNPVRVTTSGWMNGEVSYGSMEASDRYYRMWVAADGSNGWKVGYVYSWTGYNWSNTSSALISPKAGTPYSSHLLWPVSVPEDDGYTLFARGVNGTGVGTVMAFAVTPTGLNGSYTCDLKDLGSEVTLYYCRWYVDYSSEDTFALEFRWGNASDAMGQWRQVTNRNDMSGVTCRYLQYRVTLTTEKDWNWGPSFYYLYMYYYAPLDHVTCLLDGGSETNVSVDAYRWRVDYTDLQEGEHQLVLWGSDDSGANDTTVHDFIVDLSAPTGNILIEHGSNTTADTEVSVLLIVSDVSYVTARVSSRSNLEDALWYRYVQASEVIEWNFGDDTAGEVRLYVQYVDRAGRLSPIYNDSIIIDRDPPVASLSLNGGSRYTNSSTVDLTMEWWDESGVSLMWVSNDPDFTDVDWILPRKQMTWTLPEGEGNWSVYVRLIDGVGWFTNVSAWIIVDLTPPEATLVIDHGAEHTSSSSVRLDMTVSEGSPFEVALLNQGDPWPESWFPIPGEWIYYWGLAPGGDGPRTVLLAVRDAAGNTVVVSDSIVLDTTPPVGRLVIEEGAELTKAQEVRLRIIATDLASGLDCMIVSNEFRFPDNRWRPFEEELSWNLLLGDGDKRVYVMLRDGAGLTSIVRSDITLDTTPPEGSMTIGDGQGFSMDPAVVLHLSYDDAYGVADVRVSNSDDMAGAAWMPYTRTVAWDLVEREGPHTVHFEVRDAAGNVLRGQVDVFLDLTDPAVTVLLADGAEVTLVDSVQVSWAASDGRGLSGVRIAYEPTFKGARWELPFAPGSTTASGTDQVHFTSEGERLIYVQVRDLSGRVATGSDSIIRVWGRPQGALVLGTGTGWTNTTALEVSAVWTGASEATHFRVALTRDAVSTAEWTPIDDVARLTLRPVSGTHTVHGQLRAAYDITSLPLQANITLDLSPPLVQVLMPTVRRTSDGTVRLSVGVLEDMDPVPSTRWRVNEGPWNTYWGETMVRLEEGKNVIEVESADEAGNTGTTTWTLVREVEEAPLIGPMLALGIAAVVVGLVGLLFWRRSRSGAARGEGPEGRGN